MVAYGLNNRYRVAISMTGSFSKDKPKTYGTVSESKPLIAPFVQYFV